MSVRVEVAAPGCPLGAAQFNYHRPFHDGFPARASLS